MIIFYYIRRSNENQGVMIVEIRPQKIIRHLVMYIIMILLLLGLINYLVVTKMADLTNDLYNHPFTVSTAVLRINTNLLRLRLVDNNLARAVTAEEVKSYRTITDQIEAQMLGDFQLVQERFLGDPLSANEALQAFLAEKAIREEITSLALQGRQQEAIMLNNRSGITQSEETERKINVLRDFAKNKAQSFFSAAQATRTTALGLVLFSCVLALALSGLLFRKAVQIENSLHQYNEQLEFTVKQRTTDLSSANEQLIAQSEELTAMNDELTTMNIEVATINSELEMRVDERTADLTAANEELTAIEEELRTQFIDLIDTQKNLQHEMALSAALFDSVPGILYLYNDQGQLVRWNKKHEEITGYSALDLAQMNLYDWFLDDDKTLVQIALKRLKRKSQHYFSDLEANLQKKDGTNIPMYFTAVSLAIEDRMYFAGIGIDITERQLANEKLKHLVLYDALTQLYNRGYFETEMSRLDKRESGSSGVIICDVNGLKLINDTLGHQQGDNLLIKLASILTRCFRSTDVVARIGGDEFAIIIEQTSEALLQESCRRVQTEINCYNADNLSVPISLSTGYAFADSPGVAMAELYKLADYNMYREKLLHEQSTRSAIVQTVMKLLEVRDLITEEHAERLQALVSSLGSALKLSEGKIVELRLLAQFHDVGKVGIPDRILMKPGPLTSDEMTEMQRHCDIGYRIALLSPELAPLADWILKHQEWWNGGGYPLGLSKEAIPFECRILAIADAYDAMTSDRPYRKALDLQTAFNELKQGSGKQFDPNLVKLFIAIHETTEQTQAAYI